MPTIGFKHSKGTSKDSERKLWETLTVDSIMIEYERGMPETIHIESCKDGQSFNTLSNTSMYKQCMDLSCCWLGLIQLPTPPSFYAVKHKHSSGGTTTTISSQCLLILGRHKKIQIAAKSRCSQYKGSRTHFIAYNFSH